MAINKSMCEQLVKGGDRVTLLTSAGQEGSGFEGVEMVPIPLPEDLRGLHRTARFQRSFERLMEGGDWLRNIGLKDREFDVIVSHGWTTIEEAVHLGKWYPSAVVMNFLHNDLARRLEDDPDKERANRIGERFRKGLPASDVVVCAGPIARESAQELLSNSGRHPGLLTSLHQFSFIVEPPPAFKVEARAEHGRPSTNRRFTVVMVGGLESENKKVMDGVLAMDVLRERMSEREIDVHFIIQGPEESATDLRVNQFRAKIDQRVGAGATGSGGWIDVRRFTEDRAMVTSTMREGDAFLVLSGYDAFPLVVGEFARLGIPGIVAKGNANGVAEVLSDETLIPAGIGRCFVLDDAGSVSWNGMVIGGGPVREDAPKRWELVAARLEDMMSSYSKYLGAARDLGKILEGYTPQNAVKAIRRVAIEAQQRKAAGSGVVFESRQGPNGEVSYLDAPSRPAAVASLSLAFPQGGRSGPQSEDGQRLAGPPQSPSNDPNFGHDGR